MNIAALRSSLGLSMEAFAEKVGVKSKSYVHKIEHEKRCSVKVALKIEELSGGQIDAASLNASVALSRGEGGQA